MKYQNALPFALLGVCFGLEKVMGVRHTATQAFVASTWGTPLNCADSDLHRSKNIPSASGVLSESGRISIRKACANRASALRAGQLTFGEGGEDRVAIVTGASRGIGMEIAKVLAKGGVKKVICVARDQAACDAAAEKIAACASGVISKGYGVDVADSKGVSDLCQQVIKEFGKVDILVNNAGITRDNLLLRMSEEEWSSVLDTNLSSAFYFTKPLIRNMAKNKFGRIINISSVVGIGGNVGQANYAASKAGLIGFTKTLAKEYASKGVSVNAVAPGFIQTQMTDKIPQEIREQIASQIPAGHLGKPVDVANVVLFLASDQSGYVNGQTIRVDGALPI